MAIIKYSSFCIDSMFARVKKNYYLQSNHCQPKSNFLQQAVTLLEALLLAKIFEMSTSMQANNKHIKILVVIVFFFFFRATVFLNFRMDEILAVLRDNVFQVLILSRAMCYLCPSHYF